MLDKKYSRFTSEELERQYSPVRSVPDFSAEMQAYIQLSKQQHDSAVNATFGISYGELASNTYDFFAPTADNTGYLYVFIHGGYWRYLSKNESAWMVGGLQQQGCSVAVLDYTLCPENTVGGIVEECQNAIVHMVKNAEKLGFEANKIILCGSSAGGHLVTMMALTNWADFSISDPLRGIIAVSGLFDLNPLVVVSVNETLGLNYNDARALSPAHSDRIPNCPVVVAWGEYETAEFKRQSVDYANHLKQKGCNVTTLQVQGKNHFDVILDFGKPGTELMDLSLKMML